MFRRQFTVEQTNAKVLLEIQILQRITKAMQFGFAMLASPKFCRGIALRAIFYHVKTLHSLARCLKFCFPIQSIQYF